MQIGAISIKNENLSTKQIVLLSELIQQLILEKNNIIGFSTCHRHELYFKAECLEEFAVNLSRNIQITLASPMLKIASFFKRDCFRHLAELMSGLNSPILGESHILNQVKSAYEEVKSNKKLPSEIHFLFQKSLKIAKNFRFSQSSIIGRETLEKKVCEQLVKTTSVHEPILLVGNSQINRNILNQLIQMGYMKIFLASKSSIDCINKKPVNSLSYESLKNWGQFAGIVFATNTKELLIEKNNPDIQTKIVIDLSIPKVTDPVFFEKDCVYFDLEKIHQLIQVNQKHLGNWKEKNEEIIASQVEKQMTLYYLRKLKKEQILVR